MLWMRQGISLCCAGLCWVRQTAGSSGSMGEAKDHQPTASTRKDCGHTELSTFSLIRVGDCSSATQGQGAARRKSKAAGQCTA